MKNLSLTICKLSQHLETFGLFLLLRTIFTSQNYFTLKCFKM